MNIAKTTTGLSALAAAIGLAAASAFAGSPAPLWPCWRGPNGCGAADSGRQLVDDLWRAPRLWESQDRTAGSYLADSRHPEAKDAPGNWIGGGYASPIIADPDGKGSRVYVFYSMPGGEVFDVEAAARHEAVGGFAGKEKWTVDGDDTIVCMDAADGKTLWKRVFAAKGMNLNAFNKAGGHLTPAYADGKVFALGTAGRIYAVNAVSGEPVWEGDIGPTARKLELIRQYLHKTKRLPYFNRDLGSCPAVAGGAVVFSDHVYNRFDQYLKKEGGWLAFLKQQNVEPNDFRPAERKANGLIAFDAGTGRKLWTKADCIGNFGSPVRWTAPSGAEYFITQLLQHVWCIEPKTGKAAWETDQAWNDGEVVSVAVSGEYLVCGGGRARPEVAGATGVNCFGINEKGARKLWALPSEYYSVGCSPVIYRAHAYVNCAQAGVICVELAGGKIVGKAPGRAAWSGLIAADGRLLLEEMGRGVNLFDAEAKNFRPLGEYLATSYSNSTTPAVADGRLYFRGIDHVYCYDLRASSALPAGQRTKVTKVVGGAACDDDDPPKAGAKKPAPTGKPAVPVKPAAPGKKPAPTKPGSPDIGDLLGGESAGG